MRLSLRLRENLLTMAPSPKEIAIDCLSRNLFASAKPLQPAS